MDEKNDGKLISTNSIMINFTNQFCVKKYEVISKILPRP